MSNWFECKVSYEKMMENGMQKKVTESYYVDALSFTEAEARIIEELKPFITGEFVVSDIKRARVSEIFFFDGGDRFFRAKVGFVTLDEKTGSEKTSLTTMIVQASDIREAIKVLEKGMEGTMSDWVLPTMDEFKRLMDIFPYSDGAKKTIVLS